MELHVRTGGPLRSWLGERRWRLGAFLQVNVLHCPVLEVVAESEHFTVYPSKL